MKAQLDPQQWLKNLEKREQRQREFANSLKEDIRIYTVEEAAADMGFDPVDGLVMVLNKKIDEVLSIRRQQLFGDYNAIFLGDVVGGLFVHETSLYRIFAQDLDTISSIERVNHAGKETIAEIRKGLKGVHQNLKLDVIMPIEGWYRER